MAVNHFIKKLLKRPFFRGQDRIFHYFFSRGKMNIGQQAVKPLTGDFSISCDTKTWIGAKIAFTGDYEAQLKSIFKQYIKKGDTVIDVGANIGFHTLYFAELVGENGRVIAFEPVAKNYQALIENIKLNQFEQITPHQIALSNKNEQFDIDVDENSINPGSFNLFEKGGSTQIHCVIGDYFLKTNRIDFIKIDVEGYESFVIEGLIKTIAQFKPITVFEYDINYHKKTGLTEDHIFKILGKIGYDFYEIKNTSLIPFDGKKVKSCNVLAKQKNND